MLSPSRLTFLPASPVDGLPLLPSPWRIGAPEDEALEAEYTARYRRRVLWELLAGLSCAAPGGSLVLRLGDTLTMFSMSLLYLLHRAFRHVCLLAPFTACAASNQRFAVCLGAAQPWPDALLAHLRAALALNESLAAGDGPGARVLGELLPAGQLLGAPHFYQYVAGRTQMLAERQTRHLGALQRAADDEGGAGEQLAADDNDGNQGDIAREVRETAAAALGLASAPGAGANAPSSGSAIPGRAPVEALGGAMLTRPVRFVAASAHLLSAEACYL